MSEEDKKFYTTSAFLMIDDLKKENKKLKELCDKYEEEHNTTYQEWQKDIQANKKASEYIKENQEEEYVTGRPMLSYWAIDGLLNILQGGTDE